MKPLRYFYMNTAEILDKVFYLYKKTFFYQLLRILIIGTVSSILYFVIIFAVAIAGLAGMMSFFTSGEISTSTIIIVILIVLLILTAAFFIAAANTSASLSICKQAFYEKKPAFNQTIKETIKGAPRVFSVYLLLFLIYVPLFVIAVFYINALELFNGFSLLFETGSLNFDSAYAITSLVGLVLITIVCIIYIQTLSCCAAGCAVYEKLPFIRAFKRSLQLTVDYRFKISLVLILWFAVNYAISATISSLSTIPTILTTVFNSALMENMLFTPVLMLFQYILMIVSSLLMAPFGSIILSVIYFNQKIKKEGLDIIIELETESAG